MNEKRKKNAEEPENVDRWMVSYADFVTLLFCFFTAMYAISNVDAGKLGKFVKSMREAFEASETGGRAFSVIEDVRILAPMDTEVESVVRNELESIASGSKGGIEIRRDGRGVVISVMDKFLFETGKAQLIEDARPLVDGIASAVRHFPNMVRIEGHTDNMPISSSEFPSNWELSSQRAINVAKYFIDRHNINPGRISTTGYAEFRPVAPNDSADGRTKNRRVDIVILNEREQEREPK
ncbi:MAG: OmpA family protein [Nitrospirae bacterium]|nr:OmpA family protein [Nitrospirota bacterium]